MPQMDTNAQKNVYQEPKTQAAPISHGTVNKQSTQGRYYNRNDKSDLGENFIAPDGGWAWLICIAAGLSNLSIYPCLQQFGFIFRERLNTLNLTSSQITTIINTNPAISACTGLLNGPMFRRFTFRQVAMVGSLCIFVGIALTGFCNTFSGYMFAYALLFGFGMGISVSASSLALNTYFHNKRRRAAGFSWTITGLGPIFLPFFVTFLLAIYGVQGTVLIFAAFSLHSFVCALIYHPVYYHIPLPKIEKAIVAFSEKQHLCNYCNHQEKCEIDLFSSQYLHQEDGDKPGFDIIEPSTPMLSRANDGYFGSRLSLASQGRKLGFGTVSSSKDNNPINGINNVISEQEMITYVHQPNNLKQECNEQQRPLSNPCIFQSDFCCTCPERKVLLQRDRFEEDIIYNVPASSNSFNYNNRRHIINESSGKFDNQSQRSDKFNIDQDVMLTPEHMSFLQKVIKFFDLDLLRDFTFVNLVAGLTIINFGELNFSMLTPFILADFGFDTPQITFAMSILATLDITMRFLVPFLTEKICWDNRIFFLIGVVGIALGRTVVACSRSYAIILISFIWIGLCKGIRTIFWPLIIPSYVPLNRLPGASGLQLLISGIFTLAAGPLVGQVRDRYNYSVTLHCLNLMTFVAAGSWILEALIQRYRHKTQN